MKIPNKFKPAYREYDIPKPASCGYIEDLRLIYGINPQNSSLSDMEEPILFLLSNDQTILPGVELGLNRMLNLRNETENDEKLLQNIITAPYAEMRFFIILLQLAFENPFNTLEV
jgi:hypothetical protein